MEPTANETATPAEKPARKRARKPKAAKPPKDPTAPKRTVNRFSLRAWIDKRKTETGKPVDLALTALGDDFARRLRVALGTNVPDLARLRARVDRLSTLLVDAKADLLAAENPGLASIPLVARLMATADRIQAAARENVETISSGTLS